MTYDFIIIGAGHNGLACAAYLAKAGAKVLVVERSHAGRRRVPHRGSHAAGIQAQYLLGRSHPHPQQPGLPRPGARASRRKVRLPGASARHHLPRPQEHRDVPGPGRMAAELGKFSSAGRADLQEAGCRLRRVHRFDVPPVDVFAAAAALGAERRTGEIGGGAERCCSGRRARRRNFSTSCSRARR